MQRNRIWTFGVVVGVGASGLLVAASQTSARPQAPQLVCATYPDDPLCAGQTAACTTCHTGPPELNPYGLSVAANLDFDEPYEHALPAALRAIEDEDPDLDGLINRLELAYGGAPGDPLSAPTLPSEAALESVYDPEFALRRLSVAFCGRSPSYADVQALRVDPDPRATVHEALDACLASDYWRHEQVPRFADDRIRPIASLGTCEAMMATFEYDYHLFAWALTDGHDARALLTADFHVESNDPEDGDYPERAIVDESGGPPGPPLSRAGIACTDVRGISPPTTGGQPLTREHRAGMVTTQWFMTLNTQASYLPRTTAAAAYRNWLGEDLSLYEGIHPVEHEQLDIDAKGVAEEPCVQCHTTLDPLAYAFAYYWGVALTAGNGTYDRDRPTTMGSEAAREAWAADPPRPAIFATPLGIEGDYPSGSSLVELAGIAANSDEFARTLAEVVYQHATGGPPEPKDLAEFQAVWRALPDHGYSVDAMIHDLVDTDAFGAP